MLNDKIKDEGRVHIGILISKFRASGVSEKKLILRDAIEPFIDSFLEGIDPTCESIENFICANSYAFDGDIQMTILKLKKIAERTRSRWEELLKYIGK